MTAAIDSSSVRRPVNTDAARARRIPELDGIRGLAVMLVVLFHYGSAGPVPDTFLARTWHFTIGLGWIGVDLFFVLSGCLITGILLDTRDSPHYFKSFYVRRTLRILPLYYATVIFFFWICLPVAHVAVTRGWYATDARSWMYSGYGEQIWYWTHVSNRRTAFGFLEVSPVTHFWSLAIEEQFYLAWPFLVRRTSPKGLLKICVVGFIASFVLRNLPYFQMEQQAHPGFFYRLTPFRLDSLLLGSCIPLLARLPGAKEFVRPLLRPALAAGLGAFLAACLWSGTGLPTKEPMIRFGYSALALASFVFVFEAIERSQTSHWLSSALRIPVLRRAGEISYGIYVINWLIAAVILALCGRLLPAPQNYFLRVFLSVIAGASATWILAAVSWRFLEQPFLKLKRFFTA